MTPSSLAGDSCPAPSVQCDASQSDTAKLVYVRLGEGLLHVSAFRSRTAAERRAATCPACTAPVTIRLGKKNIWHAAHRPNTGHGCEVTAGESALHLNTKIWLRDSLQAFANDPTRRRDDGGAPLLELALACMVADDCRVPAYREWPVEWDDIQVECRVGVHQPDLVLYRDGRTVGAIEVLVSHAVTSEKAAALRALGVPWLEVSAGALDLGGLAPWTAARPLPVHRASRDVGRWRCPRHEAEQQLADARAKYKALSDATSPEGAALVEYGRALRDAEAETQRLVAEAERVRANAASQEAELRHRLQVLPGQIAEAKQRLEIAREALKVAERASQQRRELLAADAERDVALQYELSGLDAELIRFEGLRRTLSGLRPLGTPPGPREQGARGRPLFWCPIDIYRVKNPVGGHTATRGVFCIELVPIDGKTAELWLIEDSDRCLCRVEAENEAAEPILLAALDIRLAEWRAQGRTHAVIVDRPSDWIRVPLGKQVPREAWDEVRGPWPGAYRWHESERRWVLRTPERGGE